METEENKISIVHVAHWLTTSTKNNKHFYIKPVDLRVIYTLIVWEYIKNNDSEIKEDTDIKIPEKDLIKMVQLYYSSKYHKLFKNTIGL